MKGNHPLKCLKDWLSQNSKYLTYLCGLICNRKNQSFITFNMLKFLSTLLLLSVFSAGPVWATSLAAVPNAEIGTGLSNETVALAAKPTKATKKAERIMKRLERKLAKKGNAWDFDDPINKWLWFGLGGLGIAIVLGIVGLGGLAGLVGLAGVVCLVVWVLKHTGAV